MSVATARRHLGLSTDSQKRSINLALSHRGERALESVGLLKEVLEQAVRMECRAIHIPGEPLRLQPYGQKGQAINSISRTYLNCIMLQELDRIHSSPSKGRCAVAAAGASCRLWTST